MHSSIVQESRRSRTGSCPVIDLSNGGGRLMLVVGSVGAEICVASSLSLHLRMEWNTVLVTRLKQSDGDGLEVAMFAEHGDILICG